MRNVPDPRRADDEFVAQKAVSDEAVAGEGASGQGVSGVGVSGGADSDRADSDENKPELLVADDEPKRLRRPVDIGRLATLALLLGLLIGLGIAAHDTTTGANEDLVRAVHHLPSALTRLLSFLASFALLSLPLAYAINLLVRRQPRRLLEAMAAGAVALAVSAIIGAAIAHAPESALYHTIATKSASGAITVLDGYLAAVVAFSILGGTTHRRPWRELYVAAMLIYLISALADTQATVLALAISYVLGALIAIGVRCALGTVNDLPQGKDIAAALGERGVRLTSLRRSAPAVYRRDPLRRYEAVTRTGERLHLTVLDRSMIPSGALYRIYRMVRLRSDVSRGPDLSLERAAERRSLLSIAATKAGAPVPQLIAGVPCGPDAIVLAYEAVAASPVSECDSPPSEPALLRLWREIKPMHHDRVTHRQLNVDGILLDKQGRLHLVSPVDGTAFANNLRVNLDRAELLVTSGLLVGPGPAVRIARDALGEDALAGIRPALQPIAFSRTTRKALRKNKQLMSSMWDEIQAQTAQPAPKLPELERVRPRTVLMLVALIIAGYLLIGQLGSVDLATVFKNVRWQWTPLVLAGSAVTYLAAALALSGFVREKLVFLHTVLVQLAASFAGFVTPPAVGGVATNVRYLQQAGLPAAGAATSVAVSQVVNAGMHIVLLIVFAAATGSATHHRLPLPGWAFIVLGLVAVGILLMFAITPGRRWLLARIMPTLREAWPRLLDLVTRPAKLGQALGGNLLLNAAYIGALWAAVYAFGGNVSFPTVALVYLAGAAVGSAAPTPGGLGAVEAALSGGLAAAGMPGASAVSAVLLFRVMTFWLPVPAGWGAMTYLQRKHVL